MDEESEYFDKIPLKFGELVHVLFLGDFLSHVRLVHDRFNFLVTKSGHIIGTNLRNGKEFGAWWMDKFNGWNDLKLALSSQWYFDRMILDYCPSTKLRNAIFHK